MKKTKQKTNKKDGEYTAKLEKTLDRLHKKLTNILAKEGMTIRSHAVIDHANPEVKKSLEVLFQQLGARLPTMNYIAPEPPETPENKTIKNPASKKPAKKITRTKKKK